MHKPFKQHCEDYRVPAVRPLCGLVGLRGSALRDAGRTGEAKSPNHHHHKNLSLHLVFTAVVFITVDEVLDGALQYYRPPF
ncbi:uncharacterized [Tachysurus ichikawai]